MKKSILKVHPDDNVIVALRDLAKGEEVQLNGNNYTVQEDIPAKHKFTEALVPKGGSIMMYGVLVGKANEDLPAGIRLSTSNVKHASTEFQLGSRKTDWHVPDVTDFKNRTFMGFHRPDGSVGTANYWLIIPMVFCENRNIEVLKEALNDELGYARPKKYKEFAKQLKSLYQSGKTTQEILDTEFSEGENGRQQERVFKNVDGVKFLPQTAVLFQDTLCNLYKIVYLTT